MPSSSLVLSLGAILSTLSTSVFATPYNLQDSYSGSNFFDAFNFNDAADPTHGYVKYLSQEDAQNADLVSVINNAAYMGVDYYNTYSLTAQGRPSVRIETKNTYNHGLFILDLAHMPGSVCGSWPAFWSLGDGTWPANGEIDIIEGVNKNTNDLMVLHTADGCSVAGSGQSGTLNTNDCDVSESTAGCSVTPNQANSYGDGFNANGGGVYAMEWTSEAIKMWFFPRNAIPAAVTATNPDPSKFGTPTANFAGSCDIDSHFKNHKFIFDTTFCGDWAGSAYASSGCPMYGSKSGLDSCVQFVAQNPFAFAQTYWLINSFKVYNAPETQSSSSLSSSSLSSVLPAASTSSFGLTSLSIAMGETTTPSATPSATSSSVPSSSMVSRTSVVSSSSVMSSISSMATSSSTASSSPMVSGSAIVSSSSMVTGSSTSASASTASSSSSVAFSGASSSVSEASSSLITSTASMSAASGSSEAISFSTFSSYPGKGVSDVSSAASSPMPSVSTAVSPASSSMAHPSVGPSYTTEVVTAYTTYCPYATTLTQGGKTYTVTEATTLTITDCPCTITKPVLTTSAPVATPTTTAKETITTVITTSYVDVCPTGYVTSIITHTVTYCPAEQTSGAPPPGFTTKVTVCEACAAQPTTVTLTVPVTSPASAPATMQTGPAYSHAGSSMPLGHKPSSIVAPVSSGMPSYSAPAYSHAGSSMPAGPMPSSIAAPISSKVPNMPGYSAPAGGKSAPAPAASSSAAYTSVQVTKVLTMSVVPIPSSEYASYVASNTAALPGMSSAAVSAPAAYSAPAGSSLPAGGYTMPSGGYAGGNQTVAPTGTGMPSMSYSASPSQFTGAAASVKVAGGFVGGLMAVVAAMLV